MSKQQKPKPEGYAAPGFMGVLDAFKQGFSQGIDKGASLAVYHKGSLVVSAWGGVADQQARRPWAEDDFSFFFSGAKFLAGLVIADLVEKGHLSYEEKIAKYWPEFGQNGKEEITLSMLLCHQSGLVSLDEDYQLKWMKEDPRRLRQLLEKQHPLWEPGKQHGYSRIVCGLYTSELVQRVDVKGRSLSQYFHDEVAERFGLDVYIGVPKSLFYRCPRLSWPEYSREEMAKIIEDNKAKLPLHRRGEPADWNAKLRLSDPNFASLPCPSSHAIGSTTSIAKLAGILSNGGHCDGKTLLAPKTIARLQKPMVHGIDCMDGSKCVYGEGSILIPARQGDKTWFLCGHSGFGGQTFWVDTVHGFGFAYGTNHLSLTITFDNNRWRHLLEAVYDCIQEMDGTLDKVRLFESYEELLDDLKLHPVNSRL